MVESVLPLCRCAGLSIFGNRCPATRWGPGGGAGEKQRYKKKDLDRYSSASATGRRIPGLRPGYEKERRLRYFIRF